MRSDKKPSTKKLWIVWSVSTAIAAVVLTAALLTTHAGRYPALAQVRSVFVPGPMTSGHHQIELACESCHTSPLGGRGVLQESCVRCHGAELHDADDKHPLSKFTDPRNAELLAHLDARECVTCHVEHQPKITLAMGLTQPRDFCSHCHSDIATERPSHQGMAFDTCASSGCHKFHDNRALYEDFLLKHAGEKPLRGRMRVTSTNFLEIAESLPAYPSKQYPFVQLSVKQADAPSENSSKNSRSEIHEDWAASAHARNGVNCSGCHQPKDVAGSTWTDHPDQQVCSTCHALQTEGFTSGKHGMRLKEDLSPMRPEKGLLPFKSSAMHRELTCTTCHAAHSVNVKVASVRACLRCHSDNHSLNYELSKHAELWRLEMLGRLEADKGVTCATCHMPRIEHSYEEYDVRQIYVQHNQNDTLRPNEKMIRPVCMNCHGLPFSIDSLADAALIERNFIGQPARHVKSIDMALARVVSKKLDRKADAAKNASSNDRQRSRQH